MPYFDTLQRLNNIKKNFKNNRYILTKEKILKILNKNVNKLRILLEDKYDKIKDEAWYNYLKIVYQYCL